MSREDVTWILVFNSVILQLYLYRVSVLWDFLPCLPPSLFSYPFSSLKNFCKYLGFFIPWYNTAAVAPGIFSLANFFWSIISASLHPTSTHCFKFLVEVSSLYGFSSTFSSCSLMSVAVLCKSHGGNGFDEKNWRTEVPLSRAAEEGPSSGFLKSDVQMPH